MFLCFKGKKLVLINCVNCFWLNMCQAVPVVQMFDVFFADKVINPG